MTKEKYEVSAAADADEVQLQMLGAGKRDAEGSHIHNDESPPDGPYDPHLHRNRPVPTTNWETLVHLLKGSLGTGILAMPNAFMNAGLIIGTISTILIGILCTYCLHILVKAQYELCKRLRVPMLSYPVSMQKALEIGPNCMRPVAKSAAIIVDVFLIVYQLGICCVYIVFVATTVKKVVDVYHDPLDVRLHMLFLLIPLILINYIRNLKRLAPLSTIANIVTFVGLGIVLYFVFQDLPSIQDENINYVGTLKGFPLYVGTTLFALEAVGVIIALENNMKTPKSFGGYCGVLNIGMVFIVILYVLVGFFGYIKYNKDAKGSITLNLPANELSQAVQVLFAIAIFITYALQSYVPVEIIWNTYLKEKFEKSKYSLLYEYILRTVLVLVTFLLAVAIPNLELFISLFGALCLSALGIAFPAIIELCVYWPDKFGPCKYIFIKDLLLILCGILGLIVGTYCSVSDIIATMI